MYILVYVNGEVNKEEKINNYRWIQIHTDVFKAYDIF